MPPIPSTTATYFITSSTFMRKPLLARTANAELLLEVLQHYRKAGHYKLHAYVAMPDHIHLLMTPQGITIERAVGLVKGGFSHRLDSKFPAWQKGFHDRRIRDAEEFIARREYIHLNPVRGGLVKNPRDFPYSSAFSSRTSAAEAADEADGKCDG